MYINVPLLCECFCVSDFTKRLLPIITTSTPVSWDCGIKGMWWDRAAGSVWRDIDHTALSTNVWNVFHAWMPEVHAGRSCGPSSAHSLTSGVSLHPPLTKRRSSYGSLGPDGGPVCCRYLKGVERQRSCWWWLGGRVGWSCQLTLIPVRVRMPFISALPVWPPLSLGFMFRETHWIWET